MSTLDELNHTGVPAFFFELLDSQDRLLLSQTGWALLRSAPGYVTLALPAGRDVEGNLLARACLDVRCEDDGIHLMLTSARVTQRAVLKADDARQAILQWTSSQSV